jgi:hypothetical protein
MIRVHPFTINLSGEVIAWNRAQAALTGISGDEIIGKGDGMYARALYGDNRPMLVDTILNERIPVFEYYREICRDAGTITAETSWGRSPSKRQFNQAWRPGHPYFYSR